ncbi:ribosome biogenesis GTP-binding protein YihA/YsxC [Mycoplasma sp. Ms02]|uniref:ribosome biogenesis GTP-binding protein YihA/YsxC n=1 Tax=Mycoplasma sp. Ms02 TaxID=353851 RepID=UPI001C8A24C1|nr:ribosome biogenesis GTP-binding protein YihA/YsxC [Mycoplasma sp. Ms02]QZE12264.1 ribosome biogenesis GTP-binding protein YihA/YsxC [Mycoplasma sp. Ms02]
MYKFIKSATNSSNWYEHEGNEVCFWGRSNVGKSSLINALTKNSKLARVSKTPGRTQLLNYFADQNGNVLVDLPGYGYAKMSKTESAKMLKMIEDYLLNNPRLSDIILLFDSRTGVTKIDQQILDFICSPSIDLPITVVFTKIDKLNQSERHKLLKSFQEQIQGFSISSVFMVSSEKGTNILNLSNHIDSLFSKESHE